MSSPWIFVCPSSRGIGFALTRLLLARTPSSVPILATTRHPSPEVTKAALLEAFPDHDTHDQSPSQLQDQHPTQNQSQSQAQNQTHPQYQHLSRRHLSRRLTLVRCDVTDESSIAAAAQHAQRLFPRDSHHLHLAAAIPGVLLNPEKSPLQIDAAAALQSFQINTVGPLLLAKHFFEFLPRRATTMREPVPGSHTSASTPFADAADAPIPGAESEAPSTPPPAQSLSSPSSSSSSTTTTTTNNNNSTVTLPPHATWLNMAARVGSTTDNHAGGWFSYRASKAGVTSLTRSLDVMLQTRAGPNAIAVAYHPGTVMTDLSRDFWGSVPSEKLLTPEFAAGRMLDVVCGLGLGQRGRCWAWDGKEVPP